RSPFRPTFECGGHLVTDSGIVASEGFPTPYKPNSKCTWYITVPEGHVVMMSFRLFDLEADPTCRYDYLDIYNGHSRLVQKLGRFCGTFRPGALISTSNTMMLEMVSDEATGGRGFLAYFNAGKPHMEEDQFCGGRLTKTHGSVKTPNWPNSNYPAGISCSWHISVPPSNVIEVKFEKLDLEPDTYCRYDYVALFNGGETDNSRRIGKFCESSSPTGTSSSSSLCPTSASPPTDSWLTIPACPAELGRRRAPGISFMDLRPHPSRRNQASPSNQLHQRTHCAHNPVREREPFSPPTALMTSVSRVHASLPLPPLVTQLTSGFPPVITGKVTAVLPGPSSAKVEVSLIKNYKPGRLSVTKSGPATSVTLTSTCKRCPGLTKGLNYVLMGGVDAQGNGVLTPASFTLLYKPVHAKALAALSRKAC
ncbi:unnamed protein product, partial [Tetraodon nigroviridis]